MIDCVKDMSINHLSNDKLVVFLHGYKGDKDELRVLTDISLKVGSSLLKITYGKRNAMGEIISLNTVDEDVSGVINKIIRESNYKKVYLVGYSLGAAIAIRIVANQLIICTKLILISIFDDRQDLLKERGQKIVTDEDIKPVDLIKKIIDTPIVFIHGSLDKSINISRAKRVFANANEFSSFVSLPTNHSFVGKGLENSLTTYLSDQL